MNLLSVSYDWHNDPVRLETVDVMTEYEERFSGIGKKILRVVADFTSVTDENMA